MTSSGPAGASDDASEGLSLKDAAEIYDLSLRTLSNRVRNGEVQAVKRRGPWGHEWRVTPEALEAFGYKPRSHPPRIEAASEAQIARLQRDLAAAQRAVAGERSRADEADRMLGAAMREVGRLRAALREVQHAKEPARPVDLSESVPAPHEDELRDGHQDSARPE